MKYLKFVFVFLIITTGLWAEKVAVLTEVLERPPIRLIVNGDRIYVAGNTGIYIYSTAGYKFLNKFCKKGEGPEEFKRYPEIKVTQDGRLYVEDRQKIMFFSRDGIFKKEFNPARGVRGIRFLGDGCVGSKSERDPKTNMKTRKISVYDKDFNVLKTLYEKSDDRVVNLGTKKMDFMVVPQTVDYEIHADRIFLADTGKGFYFSVFDKSGKLLYEIDKPYKKKKMTDAFKKEYMGGKKESPRWKQLERMMNFVFPEEFPAFRNFFVREGKIYVFTYEKKDETSELIVLNLKGKELFRTFLPDHYPRDITRDTFYYLKENEDEEVWELHAQKVK